MRDAVRKPLKVKKRVVEPQTPDSNFDQYVEHAFASFPLEKIKVDITGEMRSRIEAMEGIDECPSMLHFIMIHKIQPKIYMLRSDAELDHVEFARNMYGSSVQPMGFRESLALKAKERQPLHNASIKTRASSQLCQYAQDSQLLMFATPSERSLQSRLTELKGIQPAQSKELSRFEQQIRCQTTAMFARNFRLAKQIIQKAFNNYPSEICQYVLKFNMGLCCMMLGEYQDATRTFVSILLDSKAENMFDLQQYALLNLLITVALRNGPSCDSFKELKGL